MTMFVCLTREGHLRASSYCECRPHSPEETKDAKVTSQLHRGGQPQTINHVYITSLPLAYASGW